MGDVDVIAVIVSEQSYLFSYPVLTALDEQCERKDTNEATVLYPFAVTALVKLPGQLKQGTWLLPSKGA